MQVVGAQPEIPLERLSAAPEDLERVAVELASRPVRSRARAAGARAADRGRARRPRAAARSPPRVCDGWSHVVVLRELGELYGALPAGRPSTLPAPRAAVPRLCPGAARELRGRGARGRGGAMGERLPARPRRSTLPTDHPRPGVPSYRGTAYDAIPLGAGRSDVRAFARQARRRRSHAVGRVLRAAGPLQRAGGHRRRRDHVGTHRRRARGWHRPVREHRRAALRRVGESRAFRELVDRVRDAIMWAVAHEEAPFERSWRELGLQRDLSRHPVFQVFVANVAARRRCRSAGAEPYHARPAASRFDLTLFVEEEPADGLRAGLGVQQRPVRADTIERLGAASIVRLLERGAGRAGPRRIGRAADAGRGRARRQRPAAAAPPDYPRRVHARAVRGTRRARRPTRWRSSSSARVAHLRASSIERANRLAHRLRELGAGPETLVALFLEPSLELVDRDPRRPQGRGRVRPARPRLPGRADRVRARRHGGAGAAHRRRARPARPGARRRRPSASTRTSRWLGARAPTNRSRWPRRRTWPT